MLSGLTFRYVKKVPGSAEVRNVCSAKHEQNQGVIC